MIFPTLWTRKWRSLNLLCKFTFKLLHCRYCILSFVSPSNPPYCCNEYVLSTKLFNYTIPKVNRNSPSLFCWISVFVFTQYPPSHIITLPWVCTSTRFIIAARLFYIDSAHNLLTFSFMLLLWEIYTWNSWRLLNFRQWMSDATGTNFISKSKLS